MPKETAAEEQQGKIASGLLSRLAVMGLAALLGACSCSLAETEPMRSKAAARSQARGTAPPPQPPHKMAPAIAAPRAVRAPIDAAKASTAIDTLVPRPPAAANAGAASKVSLHVVDGTPDRLALVLAKAREIVDHTRAQGKPGVVEIVLEAGAVNALAAAGNGHGQALLALAQSEPGIGVTLCDGLADPVVADRGPLGRLARSRRVASCGARIIELKAQGYAYIRL